MSHPWRGWCLLRPGLLLFGGTVGRNDLHAHHAVQLIVSAQPFTMGDAHGGELTTQIAIVPPDVRHAVRVGAHDALLVLLDPRSSPGRSLLARFGVGSTASAWAPALQDPPVPTEGVRPLMFAEPAAGHARSAEAAAALRTVEGWTGHSAAEGARLHPAVEAAIAVIPTLLRRGPVRLRTVADTVHLSPSRLAHLFGAHVGIPLRPYVRWLRMQRAIDLVAAGQTLTAAAHSAGFTDGPHFTRVFRETFGNTPSELAAAIDWLP
ncbi:helix-turn-helix transcriptional regulator [Nonomuraea endophytica]|uniref:AraC-like DNA-binding protein n=1 Tax=Nonomuraea endophytica TaxID=714136 RepID=A0A7W8A9B2_9ACTN|nr:helix-turn-helix transcriptional regulator [Nonomuraea endophytica]MBB5082022.1 AraC-like DNA-binding protein [Nonomuraea endophytica]